MIVFPAIDLKGGQVVRLAEGDMDRATVYGDDPVAWVRLFAEAGAEHIHVVDLDGAFAGESRNRAAVERIVEEFPGYVQLGGGIRTPGAVEGWFELGVARVVIGTAALKDPQFRPALGRDHAAFRVDGDASLLFTDIGRDGLLTGCNIEATVDLARRTSLPVIASGGVKGLDDIRMLAIHADEGIEGVITGRAIYDGRLDVAAAIAMAERT